MKLHADLLGSFVGAIGLAVDPSGALVRTAFLGDGARAELEALLARESLEVAWSPEACRAVTLQLAEYFRGRRRVFEIVLAPRGGTDFQRSVWDELARIPYGTTIPYGELARRVGQEGGARAVGQANHVNPLPIVVPCHRVIGADGMLTGFGGGLDAKRRLVDFEQGQGSLF